MPLAPLIEAWAEKPPRRSVLLLMNAALRTDPGLVFQDRPVLVGDDRDGCERDLMAVRKPAEWSLYRQARAQPVLEEG